MNNKKEDWMNSKWRPAMGWMYMLICTMDMVVFPVLWSLLQAMTHTAITQWNPLTLQGAGLFHIAMGAVLGIAAFGRTQEKLNGANNGGANTTPSSGFTTPSVSAPVTNSWGSQPLSTTPATGGFGSGAGVGATAAPVPSFGAPAFGASVGMSASGKPMPAQPEPPLL